MAAAGLGATALYNRKQARAAERKHPPIGRFLEADGVRLHYVERGQGDPVVLFHGNGSMIQELIASGLVDELASRYRVIVFDRPGYGYSTRPGRLWTARAYARLFRSALERLGVDEALVLGHSWGALVAIALALEAPPLVRGLVLVSGYYYPTPRPDVLLFSLPAVPGAGDVARHTFAPWITRAILPTLIRRTFEPNPIPARFRRQFPAEMALRPSQLRAVVEDTALMIPSAADLARHYQDLDLPVTIVAGTDDRIVDFESHSLRLHEELPGSRFMSLPGLGHMVHHFVPKVIADLVDHTR